MSDFNGVRFARQDEADKLYHFLTLLHAENGMFPLDERKARATLNDLLAPPLGVIGVIDGPDGIEAAIGLYTTAWWYTRELHITEFFTFVKKEARRSSHAKHLINFAKWFADGLGLPLHIGIITTQRSEAKQKLYRRLLPQVGGYFLYGGKATLLGDELPSEPVPEDQEKQALIDVLGAAKRVISAKPSTSRRSRADRDKAERTRNEALVDLRNAVARIEPHGKSEATVN